MVSTFRSFLTSTTHWYPNPIVIQGKLQEERDDPRHLEAVMGQILCDIPDLMLHPFGNYLCQRLFEVVEYQSHVRFLDKILDEILTQRSFLKVSIDPYGTQPGFLICL